MPVVLLLLGLGLESQHPSTPSCCGYYRLATPRRRGFRGAPVGLALIFSKRSLDHQHLHTQDTGGVQGLLHYSSVCN